MVLQTKTLKNWSEEERKAHIDAIFDQYKFFTAHFFEESNRLVKLANGYGHQHSKWRCNLIIATGILAVINVLASFGWSDDSTSWMAFALLDRSLPLIAAVYASALAIFATLENLHNWKEKSNHYRESREIYLDSYRKFELLWNTEVSSPKGSPPKSCQSATDLLERIVEEEKLLRAKIKEMETAKKSTD